MLDGIPITIKVEKPETEKPNPKMGVGQFSFNHDGTLLFTIVGSTFPYMTSPLSDTLFINELKAITIIIQITPENMSNTLWIWEVQSEKLLHLVIQINEIKAAQWHPFSNQIAILTGNNKLYLWAPTGCSCIVIPVG